MAQDKYLNERQTTRLWAKIKAYVTNAIGGITSVSFVIVQTLPSTGAAGAIYLVPNSGSSPNIYDEYIYVANAWEKIGTTEIDLSGYVQTSRKVNNKALSADITLSASDVGAQAKITASGLLKSDGSGNITPAVAGTDYIASHQDISGKLDKSGGTLTGALTLAGDPVSDLQAATKKYVDDNAGRSEDTFIAEYGVTSASDILSAREGGKVVYVKSSAGYAFLVTGVTQDSTKYTINCVAFNTGSFIFYIDKSTGSWSAGPYYEFAKLSSPAFTGTPTAPTAASGTDTTQIATTAFVQDALESVDALPSQTGKNGKYLKTNGTAASWEDGPAQTAKIWTGYCTTARDAEAKVVVLDDPTGFSLSSNNRIAVKFADGIELASNSAPTLNVNNTGALRLFSPGNAINTYNQDADKLSCSTQGTCLFSFNTGLGGVGGWVRETSGFVLSKAYSTAMSALPVSGGTMTGALTLSGAPTSNLHASTKKYVDDAVGDIETLLASI